MPNNILKFITLFSLIALTSCSGRLFTVHKIDVQQGNAVEPEKVSQLEIGMSREQVKFLLGTPLIQDVFHPERWDYVFFLIPDYGDIEKRRLVVHFDGDIVSAIDKEDVPEPTPEVLAEDQAMQEKLISHEEKELKELDAKEVPEYIKNKEKLEEIDPDI